MTSTLITVVTECDGSGFRSRGHFCHVCGQPIIASKAGYIPWHDAEMTATMETRRAEQPIDRTRVVSYTSSTLFRNNANDNDERQGDK